MDENPGPGGGLFHHKRTPHLVLLQERDVDQTEAESNDRRYEVARQTRDSN
jgi:hypothetical protein